MSSASAILVAGAQSSLTGGATPRGELVISTRALTGLSDVRDNEVVVGAGVPLRSLQQALRKRGFWYPPAPTFDGASVGGTISTNAAGAATFKYGTTREWVSGLAVVLADGTLLRLRRGDVAASKDGWFEIVHPSTGSVARVPVPRYHMPAVPKLSAGYCARHSMDLVDLFVGSEGTLGIVVEATLRVRARPRMSAALIECTSEEQALAVTRVLRAEAVRTWSGEGLLDVAAIEYMDAAALALVPDEAFQRTSIPRPATGNCFVLVQFEVGGREDATFARFEASLDEAGVGSDPMVAWPDDETGASKLFEIREAVPAAVNAAVGTAQTRVHPQIQKTAGDMIVPFERLAESLAVYRRAFDRRGLHYAIWGHVSDGNLHPNVVPHSYEDMARGREALLEIARDIVRLGGAPLAEHGVGRSDLKQQMMTELYGEDGIAQMRSVKRALDPAWKCAPGVLFAR